MSGYSNLTEEERSELAEKVAKDMAAIPDGSTYYDVTCCGDTYYCVTDRAVAEQIAAQGNALIAMGRAFGLESAHELVITERVKEAVA